MKLDHFEHSLGLLKQHLSLVPLDLTRLHHYKLEQSLISCLHPIVLVDRLNYLKQKVPLRLQQLLVVFVLLQLRK